MDRYIFLVVITPHSNNEDFERQIIIPFNTAPIPLLSHDEQKQYWSRSGYRIYRFCNRMRYTTLEISYFLYIYNTCTCTEKIVVFYCIYVQYRGYCYVCFLYKAHVQFSYRKYCSLEHDGVTDSIPGLGYEVILLDGKSSGLLLATRLTNKKPVNQWSFGRGLASFNNS